MYYLWYLYQQQQQQTQQQQQQQQQQGIHINVRLLKRALTEVFAYYSKAPLAAVKARLNSLEDLPMGLTVVAFKRFCFDLKLQQQLLSDEAQ
ncbi:hypothetical protein ETH_00023200, partial [Eimeria tenella]